MADGDLDPDAQAKADLAEIPKIPYSRGLRLSGREIMRIAMLLGTLVLLLVMQQPCARAVSSFVSDFDVGSAGSAHPGSAAPVGKPPQAGVGVGVGSGALVHLPAGMTDEQMKATIDKARAGSATP